MTVVERRGDRVVRDAGDWTPAVHRLLAHLQRAGVDGVPVPHGRTDDGREVLGFLDGEVPHHPVPAWVWTVRALESSARLLRRIHDATEGASLDGPWRSPTHEPPEVVCHNDFAPYNLVFEDGVVVGVIDWDFASPGPRLWDLAYLAYRIVPLTTDDWGDAFPPSVRRERLIQLLRAYGTSAGPADLLAVLRDRLLELADFSERTADPASRPELREHAQLYRRDAESLLSP